MVSTEAIKRFAKIFLATKVGIYRKRGKIRWAKHSRFQPYEVFRGNTFRGAVATSVRYYLRIAKNSRENFRGKLKNRENFANV